MQPLGIPLVDTTPTAMNLSFILDNNLLGNFSHQGSKSASGYASHVNIFAQTNLTETPHVLRVDVGLGSVFLFDYMVFTRDDHNDTIPNPPSTDLDECVSIPFHYRDISIYPLLHFLLFIALFFLLDTDHLIRAHFQTRKETQHRDFCRGGGGKRWGSWNHRPLLGLQHHETPEKLQTSRAA